MTLGSSESLVQSAQGVCYQPVISKVKKEKKKHTSACLLLIAQSITVYIVGDVKNKTKQNKKLSTHIVSFTFKMQ